MEGEFPPLHRGAPRGEKDPAATGKGWLEWREDTSHAKRSAGYEPGQVAAWSLMTSGRWCWSGRGEESGRGLGRQLFQELCEGWQSRGWGGVMRSRKDIAGLGWFLPGGMLQECAQHSRNRKELAVCRNRAAGVGGMGGRVAGRVGVGLVLGRRHIVWSTCSKQAKVVASAESWSGERTDLREERRVPFRGHQSSSAHFQLGPIQGARPTGVHPLGHEKEIRPKLRSTPHSPALHLNPLSLVYSPPRRNLRWFGPSPPA